MEKAAKEFDWLTGCFRTAYSTMNTGVSIAFSCIKSGMVAMAGILQSPNLGVVV